MIERVLDTIKEYNMISQNDKIIVAVSGGPDSICLLHILYKLKEIFNITLYAAHLNHCLRGDEADKDEEYVKEFCNKLGIECFTKKIDINKLSKERGISSESAGREARYEFFDELLKKLEAQKIALAHNANDQAETVLMRIMRGTGMEGLVGIKPVRSNIFIRPLINIKRENIEKYCKENNLNPRIDKTNLESIYTRNKIRLELIPYLQKNFNKDIINVLNRLADTIIIDNDYLDKISKEKYNTYCENKAGKVIIYKGAFSEEKAILNRIIRKAINNLKGNLYDIEKIHIKNLIELQKCNTGKKINLPNGIIAFNNYGDIELTLGEKFRNKPDNDEYILYIDRENIIESFNLKVSLRLINKDEKINFKENSFVKYFDFDSAPKNIYLRTRRNGDKFTPLGMKGSKKLKDLFIDLKVPKEERDTIPIIVFDDEIVWIVGYRISEKYKINKNTKKILEIKITEGEKNERRY
ncbi:tRNA(Ile)-lysidine synthase [Clostridium sp. USBA 49]|uniref:tRNA lysidine(34) synthetase TilS n=1 Tax=Clostridium TaxID=1485 RepID=UPI0009992AA1|nr:MULTISPECIES: tRNA lysidine(34) synthetase TilS [Clostridium]SKA78692.1 tRNA(Ile)-lysidine synthase [Clostridium sp. USBA 49]